MKFEGGNKSKQRQTEMRGQRLRLHRRGADEEATFEDNTNSFRRVNLFLDFKCRRNSEQQWRQVINNRGASVLMGQEENRSSNAPAATSSAHMDLETPWGYSLKNINLLCSARSSGKSKKPE